MVALQKTLSFGETVLFDSALENAGGLYNARRFFGGLRNIQMRDMVSADKIRQLAYNGLANTCTQ